jgi:hypothetical protein
MKGFKENVYNITLEDLEGDINDFPFAKVIQPKWSANRAEVYEIYKFKKEVQEMLKRYKLGEITQNKVIEDIYEYRRILQCSGKIPALGWYDIKVCRELPENIKHLERYEKRIKEHADRAEACRLREEDEKSLRLIRINTIRKYIVDNKLDTFSIGDLKPLKNILKINLTRWMLESLLGESLQVCKGKGNRYRMKGVEEMGMLRGKDRDFCPPAETT